jgi:hypothetical protein
LRSRDAHKCVVAIEGKLKMKTHLLGALALSLALSQVMAPTASAETAQPGHFRSAQAQSFSTSDLQRYDLSASDASQVSALQAKGYHVQVMTRAEAERVYGGDWSNHTWIIVGAVALVVIAIAAIN